MSTSTGSSCGALLDVRTLAEFQERHLAGATSIPLEELAARLYELPPKYLPEPLQLFGPSEHLRAAKTILTDSGWQIQEPMLDSTSEEVWSLASTETGGRGVRIWKPSEFLENVWPQVRMHVCFLAKT